MRLSEATLQTFSGRKPSQHPDEIGRLVSLFRERGVRRYLEVGARHGDTFHYIMGALPIGSYGLAVDLPEARWGAKSLPSLLAAVADITRMDRRAEVIIGDSQSNDIAAQVASCGPFDAVLIDADHSYDGVSRDLELYGSVAPLVAFHDIVGDGVQDKHSKRFVEVPKLWRELKDDCRHQEFIALGSNMGIGVIWP